MILGPTGVGKTELCLRVAEYFHIPIINADSRQIFREIPIGTAAPTEEQQRRVKHYFVGTHSIEDYYSASMYEEDAVRLITQLLEHDKCALMTRNGRLCASNSNAVPFFLQPNPIAKYL